jgi:hypothetical protein
MNFQITFGSTGIYDLYIICDGVYSNTHTIHLINSDYPDLSFFFGSTGVFWLFLFISMLLVLPFFYTNSSESKHEGEQLNNEFEHLFSLKQSTQSSSDSSSSSSHVHSVQFRYIQNQQLQQLKNERYATKSFFGFIYCIILLIIYIFFILYPNLFHSIIIFIISTITTFDISNDISSLHDPISILTDNDLYNNIFKLVIILLICSLLIVYLRNLVVYTFLSFRIQSYIKLAESTKISFFTSKQLKTKLNSLLIKTFLLFLFHCLLLFIFVSINFILFFMYHHTIWVTICIYIYI